MASNLYCSLKPRAKAALLILPLAGVLAAQSSSSILTVAPPAKVAAKKGGVATAKVTVKLQPGYHVNSNTPSEEYLIPLRLTWTPGALKNPEVAFPKPTLEKYEFSPKPLSVFSGAFDITTKFQVSATVPQGPALVTGKLRYQACNDKACFPPKTVDIKLPVSIQ